MLEKLNKNNSTCFCQNSNNFPHLKTQKIIMGNFFITHTNILLPGLQKIVNIINEQYLFKSCTNFMLSFLFVHTPLLHAIYRILCEQSFIKNGKSLDLTINIVTNKETFVVHVLFYCNEHMKITDPRTNVVAQLVWYKIQYIMSVVF